MAGVAVCDKVWISEAGCGAQAPHAHVGIRRHFEALSGVEIEERVKQA